MKKTRPLMYIAVPVKYPLLFCQILGKLEFSQQIVERHSNVKFPENSSSWSRVTPWGHTHYKANSRFSQICEPA